MTLAAAIAAFVAAAALLTITPGPDTAIVLRAGAVEGWRRALAAGLGISTGCLLWGLAAAVGLGALLAASHTAYTALKWAGAAYLVWMGLKLVLKPRTAFDPAQGATQTGRGSWFARGFLTNLLNPKIGVFYVSFLPQFVPAGYAPGPFMVGLTVLHAAIGLAWFALLIASLRPLSAWLKRPAVVRWLDRVTGVIFVGFGARLALSRL